MGERELWQLWTVDWLIKPAAFVIHTDVQMEPQLPGKRMELGRSRRHAKCVNIDVVAATEAEAGVVAATALTGFPRHPNG